jgi:hypothetical protein
MASKKKTKTMSAFIKEHRALVDSVAASVSGTRERLNDEDREEWVLNDTGLYALAQQEGVDT